MASTSSILLCLYFVLALTSYIHSMAPDLGPCNNIVASLNPCYGAIVTGKERGHAMLSRECCDGAALVAKERGTDKEKLVVCWCLKEMFARSKYGAQDFRNVLMQCSNSSTGAAGATLPIPNLNSSCLVI